MYQSKMFKYSDLNSEEKDNIYQLFYDTYVKSTGTSWSKSKFESRANNWIFLGNDDGFITLRPQINGLFKFTGSAGSIKGVMTGLEQLKSMNIPVWGMMTDKLAHILEMKYGFVRPNKLIIKTLLKFIPKSVFGNTDFTINNDGSITLQYSDVGNATKFFVANKQYYQFLLKNIIPQLPNVPKIVILGIKKIIGINEAINMNNIINEEILNVINEKRSNPEKNVDIGIRDFLLNLLSKYDITDIFVSFRTDTHVTDINPNNRYDTPTGFYAYPLYIYLTEEMINSDDFNIAFFRKLFPYQNQLSHIYFFALKNKTGLIYNNTDKNQLKDYVKKILQLYGHINPVKSLCDDYLNDKYQSTYTSNILNNAHSLWLFLYSVIPYIMGNNNDNKVTAVTNLCRRIGINGFIDDKTSGYIHPNEKNQAVFFRVKTIGNVFIFNQPKINKYNLQDKSNYDGDTIQKVTDNLYTWYPPNSDYKYLLNKDFKQINPKLRIFFNKEPKYNFMVIMGENKKYNYVDLNGKLLSPNMWFDDADYFDNEFARIRKDEKVNFINTEGKLMSDVWFDKASLFSSNGFSEVTKDNKINFLKKDGNLLSPNIWFDEVGFFNKGNDLVPVKINHTVYYINGNNGNFYNNNYEPISPPTNGGEKKSTINEIILEEVQNLFEEVLKYKIRSNNGNFFDVYKNPPHIKKMSNNIRGITTPNYDLYVVDDTTPHKEILHTDIRRYLSTHEGLPSNFDYNGGTQGYYAWIKVPNSDGMTLTFDTINNKINNKIDDEFLKEYIENLNEEHPYIKFYGA